MSDNINMYKTSVSQLNEEDADSYIICYNCKKLTHFMQRIKLIYDLIQKTCYQSRDIIGELFAVHLLQKLKSIRNI